MRANDTPYVDGADATAVTFVTRGQWIFAAFARTKGLSVIAVLSIRSACGAVNRSLHRGIASRQVRSGTRDKDAYFRLGGGMERYRCGLRGARTGDLHLAALPRDVIRIALHYDLNPSRSRAHRSLVPIGHVCHTARMCALPAPQLALSRHSIQIAFRVLCHARTIPQLTAWRIARSRLG